MEGEFPERMYVYHYRLFDRYHEHAVSLAVLIDDPSWRPDAYRHERFGCKTSFEFPTAKLLDYADWLDALEESDNPFAVLVRVHLEARATRQDADRRLKSKVDLVKALHHKGYERQEVLDLLRFIDWLMTLPSEMDTAFQEEIARIEEEENVSYIPSWAREAHKSGLQEGRLEARRDAVLEVMTERFGGVPDAVADAVRAIDDADRLIEIHRRAVRAASAEEFQQSLHAAS